MPDSGTSEKVIEEFAHLFPVGIFDIFGGIGVFAAATFGYLAHDEFLEKIILCVAQSTCHVCGRCRVPSSIDEKVHGDIH